VIVVPRHVRRTLTHRKRFCFEVVGSDFDRRQFRSKFCALSTRFHFNSCLKRDHAFFQSIVTRGQTSETLVLFVELTMSVTGLAGAAQNENQRHKPACRMHFGLIVCRAEEVRQITSENWSSTLTPAHFEVVGTQRLHHSKIPGKGGSLFARPV
jgi:hypothetical protein